MSYLDSYNRLKAVLHADTCQKYYYVMYWASFVWFLAVFSGLGLLPIFSFLANVKTNFDCFFLLGAALFFFNHLFGFRPYGGIETMFESNGRVSYFHFHFFLAITFEWVDTFCSTFVFFLLVKVRFSAQNFVLNRLLCREIYLKMYSFQ